MQVELLFPINLNINICLSTTHLHTRAHALRYEPTESHIDPYISIIDSGDIRLWCKLGACKLAILFSVRE